VKEWRLLSATVLAVVLAPAVATGASARSAHPQLAGIASRPPLVSQIVEGVSLGGVAVGMQSSEVNETWGTPNQHACHGTQAIGERAFDGMTCDWDTRGGRNGPLTVIFDYGAGGIVRYVSAYTEGAKRPKYRRWKTASGIGLGSSITQLERTYGSKLRTVPYRYAGQATQNERTRYVVSSLGGTRWVTAFLVPVLSTPSQTYAPFQIGRVEQVWIASAADFRSYFNGYAKASWRP
jgi:hypothetical protein